MEFQDTQGFTAKPCLVKNKTKSPLLPISNQALGPKRQGIVLSTAGALGHSLSILQLNQNYGEDG